MVDPEFIEMDEWLQRAGHDEIERLLSGALDIASEEDQQFLSQIWRDCEYWNMIDYRPEESATYHWTRKDSQQLRAEIGNIRSDYVEDDSRQQSLF